VYVDERAETGVPGLYAAGDAACVPKQHLTGAFVFGEISAESALEYLAATPPTRLNGDQVRAAEKKRDGRFQTGGREIDVRDLEYKARRFIGDYVISPKNEYKLNRWLEWARQFEEEIEHHVRVADGHELSKLYEVENIVRCANLSAVASLTRKESRWGDNHRRTDFPEQDDANWRCHIVLTRGLQGGDIETGTRPVQGLNGRGAGS
jgi:succinate dehydrogenase/fumarate reductase flavoprotein subunit